MPAVADVGSTNFDYVVCTNKAITVDVPASEQIAPAVSKDTAIVIIQNGIGVEEEFRNRFPENVIISGVVRASLWYLKHGGALTAVLKVWVNTNHPSPGTIIVKSAPLV